MSAEDVVIHIPPGAEDFDPRADSAHEATGYEEAVSCRDLCLRWQWQIPTTAVGESVNSAEWFAKAMVY